MTAYQTMLWLNSPNGPRLVLDRKPNGDCIYLTENGCSIWEKAPATCRKFDCRFSWQNSDRAGRRLAIKNKVMTKDIFERGRELTEQKDSVGGL